MCINEHIKYGFGKSVTNGCKDLFNTTNGCQLKNNLDNDWNAHKIRDLIENKSGARSFDLENLIDTLKAESCCPYYASTRTLSQDADIIFCPYSYLLNPMIRNSSGINLENAIIVLDEAHNIESACIDAGSFEFIESELLQQIEHMQEKSELNLFLGSLVQTMKETAKTGSSIRKQIEKCLQKNKENKSNAEIMENILSDFTDSYQTVLNFYQELHKLIRKFAELKINNEDYTIGSELLHKLINETIDMSKEKLDNLKKSLKILASKSNNLLMGKFSIKKLRPMHASVFFAQRFLLFLQYYKKDGSKNLYRCNIQFENKMNIKIKQEELRLNDDFKKVKVHLMCMTARLCFEDSFNSCHSVILASGTLCPVECLKSELGIKEATEMEGHQIVPSNRIFSATIQLGPTNQSMICTQNGMQELQCTMELAKTIIEICLIVPAGIICFLPNYDAIEKINKSLMECSKWDELKEKKKVLKESRNGNELKCILASYKGAIHQPNSHSPHCNGSLLLSVFRGKFSEGVDFKDELARAVICIGIPLPNIKNHFIKEKMQFNNDLSKVSGSTLLSGNEWYRTQAFKAINQALGRGLRHKMDWSALFLVDLRFAQCMEPKHADFGKISKWIRERTKIYSNFEHVKRELSEFVGKME